MLFMQVCLSILQRDLIKHMRFMWFFILSSTIFIIVLFHSQECVLPSWRRNICLDQIQQRIDLTYWRFNYTDPDDLDDILSLKPPNLLKDYKNPCWQEAVPGEDSDNIKFELRCLPYFYLIGVDKSGTTDMFLRILKHPDLVKINAYFHKETMWWAWTRFGYSVFNRGLHSKHFLHYLRIFNSAIQEIQKKNISYGNSQIYHPRVIGDGSPNTLWDFTGWNKIPQNHGLSLPKFLTPHCIHHLTPEAKFIIILRNPIDRLYSDFLFVRQVHKKFNTTQRIISRENFHIQVLAAINNLNSCVQKNNLKFCLFNKIFHLDSFLRFEIGFYSVYLKEWFKVFQRNQFYILRSEDFKANISGHLRNIFQFLNLSNLSQTDMDKMKNGKLVNTRRKDVKSMAPMLAKTRKLLKDLYQPFNNELAILLKDKRYKWEIGT